ncbi:biotin transporter BioY [Synergistaceae bacterium OttesenSCG-928-I11]|nr:biotin transporter BioY [Synergistaceae bacterium OttesenSCG-928-I11]
MSETLEKPNQNIEAGRRRISTRDMALIPLFSLLVGIGAMIRIPLPFSPVPLTLQTAMVFAAGLLLGSRRGALALLAYMVMGLLGLPVFTGGGGLHNLMLPSFGFIVGFIGTAWTAGRICELASGWVARQSRRGVAALAVRIVACLAGGAIYNVVGVLWLYMNVNYILGKAATFHQVLVMGLFPFLLPDLLKLAAVALVVSLIAERVKALDLFDA